MGIRFSFGDTDRHRPYGLRDDADLCDIFPQSLWKMNKLHCGKVGCEVCPFLVVEKLFFCTRGLWIKKCCGSKRKRSFPQKISLLMLLLKIILIIFIFFII